MFALYLIPGHVAAGIERKDIVVYGFTCLQVDGFGLRIYFDDLVEDKIAAHFGHHMFSGKADIVRRICFAQHPRPHA